MGVRVRSREALLLAAALCFACGGNVDSQSSASAGGTGGAAQGCHSDTGGGGDSELSDYAALRTACDPGVSVNRRGSPTTIHFNVK